MSFQHITGLGLAILLVGCGGDEKAKGARKKETKDLPPVPEDLSWVRKLAPGGALSYSADKVVHVVELSDGKAINIGDGFMPEFSPDGSKIAWVRSSGLWVANRDGSDRRSLFHDMFKHGGAHWLDNESLAAILSSGKSPRWYRFWLDGRRAPMPELDQFGINPERARETDVYLAEDGVWTHVAYQTWKTSDGKSGQIDGGCAPSISPDGRSITALQSAHTELKIRPVREGGITHDLTWNYAGSFDNHRWSSNDERFLVAVEEKAKRMVLIDWRSGRATAFGDRGHVKNSIMYGDFTKSDGSGGKPMPPLLPEHLREADASPVARERGAPVQLDVWPYRTDGMVYLFESRNTPNEYREFTKDTPTSSSGQLRERATFDRFGAIDLDGGRYEISLETAQRWLKRVKESGDFAIEFTAVARELPAKGETGTIIDLGDASVVHSGKSLAFEKADGSQEPITGFVPGQSYHVVLSNRSDELITFINGAETDRRPTPADVASWSTAELSLGGGWNGTIEGVALFARAIDTSDAKRRHELFSSRLAARGVAPRLVVEAKLVHYTPPLPIGEMDTYRRLVCEHVFEVAETVEGELAPGAKIRVRAWSTLDLAILPEIWKGKEGQVFRLTLEPEDLHRYVEKVERFEPYEGEGSFDLEGYFLIGKP